MKASHLVALAAILSLPTTGAVGGTITCPGLDGPGQISLTELGVKRVTLRQSDARPAASGGGEFIASRGIPFCLPAGARQVVRSDFTFFRYTTDLFMDVWVDPESADGLLYVDTKINGWAFAHIGVTPIRRKGEIVATRWQSANIRRPVGGAGPGRHVRIRFWNVPTLSAIQGGRNRMSFSINTFGGAKFTRVVIWGKTRLVWHSPRSA